MAYLAQTNPNDDQTEQTGQVNPTISTGSQDVNLAPAPLNATAVNAPPDATNPNQTKGSGFTNIQRYLQANQTGAANLGTQVAGSINDQTNQATSAVGKVNDLANSDPAADIWNTQPDINAQQAITNANQKAALTANIGGQSQLIRDIAPTTSTGGVNLDQFLMQQGSNYGQVSDAAKQAAALQGDYANKSNLWQQNATTVQALKKLQDQIAATKVNTPVTITTPSTPQVPNTSDIGANADTGATTANPYLGLSADQIAYLQSLQNSYGHGTGTNTGGNATGVIPTTGIINRGPISRTVSVTPGSGGHGGINVTGTGQDSTGSEVNQNGSFTVGADGVATADGTGLSNSQAYGIGKVISGLTGIPGLALLGSYLNSQYSNPANVNAAGAYNANNVGDTPGGQAISVNGDAPGEGDAQAQANADATNAQAQADSQAAANADAARAAEAAAAEGNNMTPGEAANEAAAGTGTGTGGGGGSGNTGAPAGSVGGDNSGASGLGGGSTSEHGGNNAANGGTGGQGGNGNNGMGAGDGNNGMGSNSTNGSRGSDGTGGEGTGTGGGGGGSGGGSSRVICTHFYQKGEMSREMWKADLEYTFKHLSPTTVRGYQYWAIPYVKLMRRSKLAENIMRPVAMYRAKELMYRMGKTDKGSLLGKVFRLVFEPTCFVIGLCVGEQDWQSLWVKE